MCRTALARSSSSLQQWISDPQALKKGTTMPPTQADSETLQAVATYLSSLR